MIDSKKINEDEKSLKSKKRIFNFKFWVCFIIIVTIMVVISIVLELDSKICALAGSVAGSLFTWIWKNMHNKE